MISIRQIHPVFVGEVTGTDLMRPMTEAERAAIDAGMDQAAHDLVGAMLRPAEDQSPLDRLAAEKPVKYCDVVGSGKSLGASPAGQAIQAHHVVEVTVAEHDRLGRDQRLLRRLCRRRHHRRRAGTREALLLRHERDPELLSLQLSEVRASGRELIVTVPMAATTPTGSRRV